MTNKELSMKIRKSLKEAGYTQKDIKVSVRSSRYDTAAKITIHNPHIDRSYALHMKRSIEMTLPERSCREVTRCYLSNMNMESLKR